MAPSWLAALREHPIRSLGVALLAVILLSALNRPDPDSDRFQLPGLLPSTSFSTTSYPPGKAIYQSPQLTRLEEKRYVHLRNPVVPGSNRLHDKQGKYLFTTITRNIQDSLPDLLNTIVVLVEFLGADKVYFSILEGPSHDETPHVLEEVLKPMLLTLGVPANHIIIRTGMPEIDFNRVNRIQALAELRNEALRPLWSGWSDTAAVVFFNDVYMKASDVLELLHQHVKAGQKIGRETGITTGMDWWKKKPQYYYDVWVGRTLDGELFYPNEWTWWSPSDNLFPTAPDAKSNFEALQTFQVYSSWNGMAVLAATPFLQHDVRFRRSDNANDECAASECSLLASDFWREGFGRVQIVPGVQLAYERDVAIDIVQELEKQKRDLGWAGEAFPPKHNDWTVNFVDTPPEHVRCHPWPETYGLDHNVWAETHWVPPWTSTE